MSPGNIAMLRDKVDRGCGSTDHHIAHRPPEVGGPSLGLEYPMVLRGMFESRTKV